MEDEFPFQFGGDFPVAAVHFQGYGPPEDGENRHFSGVPHIS